MAQQQGGGLFGRGAVIDETYNVYDNRTGNGLMLPGSHGDANDVSAPLGTGALLLIGFGAAYALKRRQK